MQTSEKGRRLIEAFEGLRLKAYRDAVGIWTIGYGHSSRAGTKPVPCAGMIITQLQADQILAEDLHVVETGVLAALKRPVSQGEFDAMVSLGFNIGLGAFRSSGVVRYFNRGQPVLAAEAFLAWDRAGGRVLPDLARRRAAERVEFLFRGAAELPPAPPENPAHAVDNPHGLVQRMAARVELEMAGAWA